jgi:SAM-dependent methyltransferase
VKRHKLQGNALDVGCAFGFLLKRLAPYFEQLHGIDISDFAIAKAQNEVPKAQFQRLNLNIDELPYPDNYFNLITAVDVLEHTHPIEESLNKIIQKLKRHGILVMSVPVKDSWAGKILKAIDKDESHVSVLSRQEVLRIIEKTGLKKLGEAYYWFAGFVMLKGIPIDLQLILQKS